MVRVSVRVEGVPEGRDFAIARNVDQSALDYYRAGPVALLDRVLQEAGQELLNHIAAVLRDQQ